MTECTETVHLMSKILHKQVPDHNDHFKEMTEEMLIAACLSYDSLRALLLNKKFTKSNRKFRLPKS